MSKNKVIDKLTPEQEAMIPAYVDRFFKIGTSTRPSDKVKAEDAITRSYAHLANTNQDWKTPPQFVWVEDPLEGAKVAAQYAKGSVTVTDSEIQEQAGFASYASFEAYWVSTYAFVTEQLDVEHDGLVNIILDIIEECGPYWTFDGLVVISPKPSVIQYKDMKLHSDTSMALQWPNGVGFYAAHGEIKSSLMECALEAKMKKDSADDAT